MKKKIESFHKSVTFTLNNAKRSAQREIINSNLLWFYRHLSLQASLTQHKETTHYQQICCRLLIPHSVQLDLVTAIGDECFSEGTVCRDRKVIPSTVIHVTVKCGRNHDALQVHYYMTDNIYQRIFNLFSLIKIHFQKQFFLGLKP